MKLHLHISKQALYKTPLHFACKKSNLQIIKLLLENGADINATDEKISLFLHVFQS